MANASDRPSGSALPRLKLAPQQRGFSTLVGPFYEIALEQGMRRALLLETRHLNPEGVVQGGVISSFGEYVVYRAIGDEFGHDLSCACIELNCQFLAAAYPSRWLYGEAHVLRRTRSLIFAAGELFDQKRRVAFVSGIWKVFDAEEE
jgi:acyl-coenzyme A thioesterase PaaI-like protein